MEQLIFNNLAKAVEPQTLIIIVGLWLIYHKLGDVERGVRSGLLAHITRIHAATARNGYISKDTLQIVTDCYAQYKRLGGDGYADQLLGEIKALPIK